MSSYSNHLAASLCIGRARAYTESGAEAWQQIWGMFHFRRRLGRLGISGSPSGQDCSETVEHGWISIDTYSTFLQFFDILEPGETRRRPHGYVRGLVMACLAWLAWVGCGCPGSKTLLLNLKERPRLVTLGPLGIDARLDHCTGFAKSGACLGRTR